MDCNNIASGSCPNITKDGQKYTRLAAFCILYVISFLGSLSTPHYLMKPNVSSSLVGLTLLHLHAFHPIFSCLTGLGMLLCR